MAIIYREGGPADGEVLAIPGEPETHTCYQTPPRRERAAMPPTAIIEPRPLVYARTDRFVNGARVYRFVPGEV